MTPPNTKQTHLETETDVPNIVSESMRLLRFLLGTVRNVRTAIGGFAGGVAAVVAAGVAGGALDRLLCQIARRLSEGGPLFVKVGQYLSTKQKLLPARFVERLKHLQSQNRFTVPRIAELGLPFEIPLIIRCIGSGSIAAVFCVLDVGTSKKYAVKVKHPMLSSEISKNAKQLRRIIYGLRLVPNWDIFWGLRSLAYFFTDELVDAMSDQQDFGSEMEIQNRIRSFLRPARHLVRIPSVCFQNEHLMVQTYEEGQTMLELEKQYGIRMVVQAISLLQTTFHNLVYYFGFVHQDLHEGNFRFRVDPRTNQLSILIYDFGYVRTMDNEQHELFRAVFKNGIIPNMVEFLRRVRSDNTENPSWDTFYESLERHPSLYVMTQVVKQTIYEIDEPEFRRMFDQYDAGGLVVDILRGAIRHQIKIDPAMLSILFNMTYMMDYEKNFYNQDLEMSLLKFRYLAIYDAAFRVAIGGDRIGEAFRPRG